LGVVIRDSSGLIIATLSQKIRLPSFLDMVETLVARGALSFTQEISIFSGRSGGRFSEGCIGYK